MRLSLTKLSYGTRRFINRCIGTIEIATDRVPLQLDNSSDSNRSSHHELHDGGSGGRINISKHVSLHGNSSAIPTIDLSAVAKTPLGGPMDRIHFEEGRGATFSLLTYPSHVECASRVSEIWQKELAVVRVLHLNIKRTANKPAESIHDCYAIKDIVTIKR